MNGESAPKGPLTRLEPDDHYGQSAPESFARSEEHTSELHHDQISYAVFCLKKKKSTRAPLVTLDTERTSLDPILGALVGMSLPGAPRPSCYLPFAPVTPDGERASSIPPRNSP